MSDYYSWAERATRKQETREDLEPPEPSEPMEVQEDPLSQTGIVRFLQRIAGYR